MQFGNRRAEIVVDVRKRQRRPLGFIFHLSGDTIRAGEPLLAVDGSPGDDIRLCRSDLKSQTLPGHSNCDRCTVPVCGAS